NGQAVAIAKEPRDVDQRVAPEHCRFLRRLLEEFQMVFRIGELCDADAPLDAARHRALLVAGEVNARLLVNKADDLLHRGLADLERGVLCVRDEWMPEEQQ